MVEHTDAFRNLLTRSAAYVDADYFQLPVAELETRTYRERVYSYELYHQLRCRWTDPLVGYTLGGEVDKRGHPLIRGNVLDNIKPDLIVHVPGDMSRNLAVVEIKAHLPERADIRRDVEKLAAFCDPSRGRYACGFFLVYGTPEGECATLVERCLDAIHGVNFYGKPLDLVVHSKQGQDASIWNLVPSAENGRCCS